MDEKNLRNRRDTQYLLRLFTQNNFGDLKNQENENERFVIESCITPALPLYGKPSRTRTNDNNGISTFLNSAAGGLRVQFRSKERRPVFMHLCRVTEVITGKKLAILAL